MKKLVSLVLIGVGALVTYCLLERRGCFPAKRICPGGRYRYGFGSADERRFGLFAEDESRAYERRVWGYLFLWNT